MSKPEPDSRSTLDRFFCGLNEFVFHGKLGVTDVQVVDYVSDLLTRFVRIDTSARVRTSRGRPVTELFGLLVESERRVGLAKREVNRHIGDFTLFWSGMYPEALRPKVDRDSKDVFLDYCAQGKRAYAIAADIEGGRDRPSCDLLARMSEQFEMCAYGLREVRRQWEESDPEEDLLLG